jgi:hypothetical protein
MDPETAGASWFKFGWSALPGAVWFDALFPKSAGLRSERFARVASASL